MPGGGWRGQASHCSNHHLDRPEGGGVAQLKHGGATLRHWAGCSRTIQSAPAPRGDGPRAGDLPRLRREIPSPPWLPRPKETASAAACVKWRSRINAWVQGAGALQSGAACNPRQALGQGLCQYLRSPEQCSQCINQDLSRRGDVQTSDYHAEAPNVDLPQPGDG